MGSFKGRLEGEEKIVWERSLDRLLAEGERNIGDQDAQKLRDLSQIADQWNQQEQAEATPLHWAARSGGVELTELVLKAMRGLEWSNVKGARILIQKMSESRAIWEGRMSREKERMLKRLGELSHEAQEVVASMEAIEQKWELEEAARAPKEAQKAAATPRL